MGDSEDSKNLEYIPKNNCSKIFRKPTMITLEYWMKKMKIKHSVVFMYVIGCIIFLIGIYLFIKLISSEEYRPLLVMLVAIYFILNMIVNKINSVSDFKFFLINTSGQL